MSAPFLEISQLWKSYPEQSIFRTRMRPVLKDISFTIQRGEIFGLLGESGSGKTTLSRCILGLETPEQGSIRFEGQRVREYHRKHPGKCSVVFQDSTTSVNPGFRVRDIIAEGLQRNDADEIRRLLDMVQLPVNLAECLPHQLSGGQLQRVCIARALASRPFFIVFDEAVSALDVSSQEKIVELLRTLKGDMTYLFITHDIQLASLLCDRFLLLRRGTVQTIVDCRAPDAADTPYLHELIDATILFSSTWEPPNETSSSPH